MTAHILEVAQAVRDQADASSESEHSDSAHTPTPPLASPQQIASSERTTSMPINVSRESTSQHVASREGTASLQGTPHSDSEQDVNLPPTPNDYTSTDGSQTSAGDEGEFDTYALTREFRRLKKVVNTQADQIKRLQDKFRGLKRFVLPLVKHHRLWVKQQRKSGQKSKKRKKKSSSITLGRNLNDNLNEDDVVPQDSNEEDHTMDFEEAHHDIAERKFDEAEQVFEEDIVVEQVKSGDIQSTGDNIIGAQSTAV